MRLLVQSLTTGKFLCPCLDGGEPIWVTSLQKAGGGVVDDLETAIQLAQDNCDFDDLPCLVDLDRLGTVNDYTVSG